MLGLGILYLCLWPVPVSPVGWDAPVNRGLVDPFEENNRLEAATLVPLGDYRGPEDLTIGFDGLLYTGTEDGKVISFQSDGSDIQVFADTGGRPLGLDYAGGFIYVANAYLGLQRIRSDGRVVVLADEFEGQSIGYADDVAVAKNGMVYFSDASSKFKAQEWGGTYEASLLDILEHGGHGRVFRYDPFSNQTTLVMDGLNFANGVAVSEDQQFLLVNETGSYRIIRHWLQGPNAGESEVVIDNLPGFPDNINSGFNGRFWIGLVSPRSDILDEHSANPFIRKMLQRLPAAIRPAAQPSTHLIAIDGDGQVVMNLQDTTAALPAVTGAIETQTSIYVSSLFAGHFGRVAKKELN
jgi:sugar lactone lactonase YvrE